MKDPILITGCARSGTSLTAGIINICGAFGGTMTGPTQYNQRGQFENDVIREKLVKPYLESMDCDRLGQWPLPDRKKLKKAPNWGKDVTGVLKKQGYASGPWMYKGAKMCLVWQMWHKAFPKAKWLIVRRRDEEIVASCLRTGFMRHFKSESGWQKWVDWHKECFAEMLEDPDVDAQEVWPELAIRGDLSEMERVVKQLKLKWDEQEIHHFVTPKLWHTA